MLSLAIQSFLVQKQEEQQQQDWTQAVERLAQWNGFRAIPPNHLLVVTNHQDRLGRLALGGGLVAETSAFCSDHYRVWAKPSTTTTNNIQSHPPFVAEDYSWYRTLEHRISDNLDRWAENAHLRRRQRRLSAQQGLQRLMDTIQAPAALGFGAVTARLGPVVERLRTTVKSHWKQPPADPSLATIERDHPPQDIITNASKPEEKSSSNNTIETLDPIASSADPSELSLSPANMNVTDPEDLLILVEDGTSLMYLKEVHPADRLLALPLVVTVDGKAKPPYRLRLARGGLVITLSVITLGALAPTYRSLRFILEYPKTAELVLGTLVASVAYNIWTWRTNARTRQQELIAAAIQSRLLARNDAAISYLTVGAVTTLTDVLMESYVSRLLLSSEGGEPRLRPGMDPLVLEIGESVGLFRLPKRTVSSSSSTLGRYYDVNQDDIVAVPWEEARTALVHCLAVRM